MTLLVAVVACGSLAFPLSSIGVHLASAPLLGVGGYATFGIGRALPQSSTPLPAPGTQWKQLHPAVQPSARYGFGLAYDAADHFTLLFGGLIVSGNAGATYGNVTNQTWTFTNGTWKHLVLTTLPPARQNPCMAYDPAVHAVVIFGGTGVAPNGNANWLNDTWSFAGGAWTHLRPGHSPPLLVNNNQPICAYNPRVSGVLMWSGSDSISTWANGTWKFANGTWTMLHPPSFPNLMDPGGESAMANDPQLNSMVMFGALNASSGGPIDPTWTFAHGTWTLLKPHYSPINRGDVTLAYDPTLRGVVVFGPHVTAKGPDLTFVFKAGTWTKVASTLEPRSIYGAYGIGLVYDAQSDRMLLLEGYSAWDPITNTFPVQTWVLQ
jgi:hypothetical protein